MEPNKIMKQSPLEKYFSVLEAIAGVPALRLSELAEACQLPISTTHRVVNTLIDSGLVAPPNNGRRGYELGPRLLRLVHAGSDESWIKIVVQKKLDELAGQLGETCYMTKLIGERVFSVAWATPPNGLKAYVVPGLSQPLHAAASAKAILAFQEPSVVRRLLVGPLPKLCTDTKTTIEDVLENLAQVRRRGFATCINENEAGIAAVACPVQFVDGQIIHAIGATGIADRLTRAHLEKYARALKKAATALGRTFRGQPEQRWAAE